MKDELNTIVRMMIEIIEKCKLDPVKYKDDSWTLLNVSGVENCQVYFNEERKFSAFICEHFEYSHYNKKLHFYETTMNHPQGFKTVIESLKRTHELVFKGPTKRKLNFN